MTNRPSLQFYPADWIANPNLRRCTHAARGAWIDIICVLHDSDTAYGLVKWPLHELIHAAGVPLKLAQELIAKGVLKGSDSDFAPPYLFTPQHGRQSGPTVTLVPAQPGPVWFSSRMIRDEYKRCHAGASTRFGARHGDVTPPSQAPPKTPQLTIVSASPSQRHGERHGEDQGDGSSSSSSTPVPSSQRIPRESSNSARARDALQNGKNSIVEGKTGREDGEDGYERFNIQDPHERLARFQAKLARRLGANGWDVVASASNPKHEAHDRNLAICKQVAKELGKGWPRAWV